MLRYLFLLLLVPTLLHGQSFTSTGNEKIVIGTNSVVSSVGGFKMAGSGTNVLSIPQGTSPYDVSPASKRVLLSNTNADYEVINVALNQKADFFIDIPYASSVALTDLSIVNKSATSNYQVSVAPAVHSAYTAIPVEWEITRTGATATDVNDLVFSWDNALEPTEILDKRLFVFNTTSLSWTLLPLEQTVVDEATNKLTYTGYVGALSQSKFMIAESSFNANIFSLTVSPGTLVPVFAPTTLKYDVTVSSSTSSFSITPTLGIAGATLTINGVAHTSGTVYTSPLVTNTTIFKLNVTSTNGLATKEYIIRVFKNLTAIPAPEKNWVDLFKGANFDPNNDQQATADTDIVGDANNPLVQAQQNFVSINGTLEKVYYFRARLANKISNNGTAPGTSFYYGLDVTNDQKLNLVVEANVKAATPYVAFHKHDPAKDGSGPSQTSWMNSTTNINIERKLNATQSKITFYPTVIDASTTKLDMDAPVGGANTGNDTWLEFAFSESSFRSFTTDALGTPKNGDEVYGLVAFTSTSQTANGDIGGINDKTADLSKSWAQLGVILTASLDDVTDPVYRDPLTVDVINTKSTNSNASVYGVWNGNVYPNSTLTVNVYNLDNTTIKQTFTYDNATKATTVNPSTPAGVISTTGLSWYIDVTDYASGNYKVEAIMSDNSVMPNSDTEIGYLLITSVKIYELLTDDPTPTISGESDQAPGAEVTIELYDSAGTTLLKTYKTTTTTDGKWSFTIPDADALTLGNYELNAKVVVGGSTSTDEILLKIVESPSIDITSNLINTYGSTVLSGTSDQPANTKVDLVLTNEAGEEFTFTTTTIAGGGWSYDLNTLPAGTYQIYVSVEDVNGIRVSDEGVLTVNKKSLIITANNATKIFGEVDPALSLSYDSFVNNETVAALGGTLSHSRTTGETVGEYPISVSGYTSGNYDISFVPGEFTITKKSISSSDISIAALADVVYNGLAYEPLPEVYDRGALTVLNNQYTITSYTDNVNVGTATINIAGAGNFEGTNSITFNINKAPLTITAEDKTKVYGEANPTLTVTYNGLVNGETASSLSIVPTISRTGLEEVGNYTITPSGVNLSNYDVSYETGNFSITSKLITSTDVSIANIADLNYNGLAQTPAVVITDSSFDPDKTLVLDTDYTATYSNNTNAGTATITITGIGNYSGVTTKTFAIVPVDLTITADNISKTFGASDPSLTLSFNGFVNSETEAVLGGTLSLSRAAGEAVNTYAITASGYTSSNYTITFVPGVFSINAKLLSSADITLSSISNVVYNGSSQSLKPIVYDNGVVLTETTDYTITHSSNTTDVGTVTVTLTGAGGYSGTKTTTYEITQAPLTIKADDQSKVFGALDPSLTVTYTGFVGTETIADLAGSLSVSRTATENVGVHTNSITASGYTSTNYNITYQAGTFTITTRPITASGITVDEVSAVTYKGTAYTPTVVVKDGTTTLASPASYTLTYADNIDAGTATINITGAGNYSGTRTVTFTINKAPLTVTAQVKSKTFGSVDPGNSVIISGFVNSQTSAVLNGSLGFTRVSGEAVGTYAITPNGYLSSNYTFSYIPANLTINAKDISNAIDISISTLADVVYKGADYLVLPIVKDGNTLLVKDTDYTLTYGNNKNAGIASITVTGIGNYSGTKLAAFNITKAPLSVIADNKTKFVGQTDPSFTASYSGLVGGEVATVLTGTLSFTRATGETKGDYDITPAGYNATQTNYTLTYVEGVLTISGTDIASAQITIDPIGDLTYNGAAQLPAPVVKDGSKTLVKDTDYSLVYSSNTDAGTASITLTGLGQYFAVRTVTFKIKPVVLTISAESKTKVYGQNDPAFTYTQSAAVGSEVAAFTGALSRAVGEDVANSPYAINLGNLTLADNGTFKASNYKIDLLSANLTITKATLTARVNDDAKFVGQPDASGYASVSYSGFVFGEDKTSAQISEPANFITRSNSTINAAGVYTGVLSASGVTAPNYNIPSYTVGDYTIVAADQLLVKIGNSKTVYGVEPTYSLTSVEYLKITKDANDNDVYTVTELVKSSSVTGANVIVNENISGTITQTASFTISPQSILNSTSGNLKVGSYTIAPGTVSESSANFNNTIVLVGSLAVTQKELKAVVSGGTTKVYDGKTAMDVLTLGFDSANDPTFSPIGTDVVTVNGSGTYASKDVGSGTYTVSNLGLSGTDAANYFVSGGASATIAGTGGTITAKTLTVTPIANQSKVFGATNPTLLYTYAGNVDGETPSFTGVLSRVSGEPQGTYNILVGDLALADNAPFLKDNYSLAFTTGVPFTINKKDLASADISIDPLASMVYTGGNQTPLPVVKEGANTLNLTSDYSITSYANNKDVGTATITITGAGNYSGTRTVTFQITKAPLTITATNASKGFGTIEPSSFAVSYSGFKASETEVNVTALTDLEISREAGENVGTYVITPSAATYANYTVSFVNGLFTIGSKDFSSTDPTIADDFAIASISALEYRGYAHTPSPVVTDNSTTLTEGTHYTVSYTDNVNVGQATVTVTGKGNYTGTKSVNFDITPKALTIDADDKTIVYGQPVPSLTATYTGFVPGETEANLLGRVVFPNITSTTQGTYPIQLNYITPRTVFSSGNYNITFTDGTLAIDTKAISSSDIIVSSLLDITYTGTAHSPEPIVKDGATSLIKDTDYTLSYSADQSNVGTVTITITGIGNYSATRTLTFNITKALLSITAENKTKEFGSADPTFTATYAGFVNGETASALSITPTFTRTVGTAVGIYPITPSAVTLANYSITFIPGSMAITARAINASGITIDAVPSVDYTGTAHTPLPVVKDASTTLIKDTDYTLSYSSNVKAGSATITITGKGNYSGTNSTTFTINPVALTITAANTGKVYGEIDPSLSVSYSGFVGTDNEADLGGTLAISRVAGETPNTYAITPSGSTSSNYTIGFVTGTFTITAKAMSTADITVDPIADLTYTGLAQTPSIVVKDKGVALVNNTDYTYLHSNNTNAGTATITITGIGNYSGTKTVNFTIKRKTLTITTDDKQKVYGTNDPPLTVSYDGFVNGEDNTDLLNTQTITRATGQSLGIYAITATGYASSNYAIAYVPGTFAISSKLISSSDVVISGVTNKVYTGIAQIQAGLKIEDGSDELSEGIDYSLIYTSNTFVGTATITISGIGDYSGSRSVTFAIAKAPLIITADNKNKTFGEADPALTVSYNGFVNADTEIILGGTLLISRAEGESATSYVITPSGYTSLNYDISFVAGTFTIETKCINSVGITVSAIDAVIYNGLPYTPIPLIKDGNTNLVLGNDYNLTYVSNTNAGTATVTVLGIGNYKGTATVNFTINTAELRILADHKEKVFGAADPTLTVIYDGFVNGETETSLNVVPTISRDPGDPVNTYAIKTTPSSVNLPNYTVTFVDGIFTITKKAISDAQITASTPSDEVYNGLAHELEPELYDQSVLLVKDTDYTLEYSDNINAGNVIITINGINNYSGSRTVNFDITKADLIIQAENKTKVFGELDPLFTVAYTGFVNSEDQSELSGLFVMNREEGEDVGAYEITPSGYLSNNYDIEYREATLTIDTKDINASDILIDVIPTLIYKGLDHTPEPVIRDGADVMQLENDYTLSFANNLNVGTAIITITGEGNYTGTRTLDFIIAKANLTVSADNKIKTFGAVDPALTVTYDGFVNEETTDNLSGTISIFRSPGEQNGEYAIIVSGWTSDNYDITFDAGTFTIGTKAMSNDDISVSSIDAVTYNGLAHAPEPILEDGGTLLIKGADYDLNYSSNVEAGTASIIFTGLNNYSGTRTVNFTIELAPLTIEAENKEKVFGEIDPQLTVTYTGFVNDQSDSDLLGTLMLSREPGEAAGTYTLKAEGYNSNNYDILYNTGSLTINAKSLSSTDISVASISDLTYQGTPFTPEPIMKDGAKEMVLNRDYTLSYSNNVNVGTASILITGIGNYSGTKSTSFVIIKKLLTISVNNNSKLIGSPDPMLTLSYSGFVASETPSVLGGELLISREPGEEMGTYIVSVEGYTSSNYDIVFEKGTFVIGDSVKPTIISKDITIELDEKGQAKIQVSDIDNGSFDAGGISSRTLSLTSFDCANVGVNNVVFTVTDFNFNVSTANVSVTVINNAPDTDGDGLKDNCDNDDDSDGVSDVQELIDGTNSLDLCSFKLSSQNLSPSTAWNNADCDGDGVSNGQEVKDGTNPLDGCVYKVASQTAANVSTLWSNQDCDSDGLTNGEELTGIDNPSTPANPKGIKTSPLIKDSDGDGASDGDEAIDGTNPNDSCSFKLSSQKLNPSSAWNNADCDGDGVTNGNEKADGTSSLSNCDLKVASRTLQPDAAWKNGDCDNDGLTNEVDGIEDCDKDGVPNFLDFDACRIDILMASVFTPNGDGINDVVKPVLLGIEKFVCFKVYNRWGNLVFETKVRETGWDGNLGTTEQSTETFQWLSEGYDRDGNLVKRTGMITLLR